MSSVQITLLPVGTFCTFHHSGKEEGRNEGMPVSFPATVQCLLPGRCSALCWLLLLSRVLGGRASSYLFQAEARWLLQATTGELILGSELGWGHYWIMKSMIKDLVRPFLRHFLSLHNRATVPRNEELSFGCCTSVVLCKPVVHPTYVTLVSHYLNISPLHGYIEKITKLSK